MKSINYLSILCCCNLFLQLKRSPVLFPLILILMFIWYFLCSQCVYAFVCVCACTTTLPSLFAADIDVFAFVVIHDVVSSRRMLLNVVGWCHITTTWARNYNILHIFSLRFLFFSDTFFDTVSRYLCLSLWVRVCVRMCVCVYITYILYSVYWCPTFCLFISFSRWKKEAKYK